MTFLQRVLTRALLVAFMPVTACDGRAPSQPVDASNADGGISGPDFVDQLARAACVAISRCGEADLVETRSFAGVGEACVRRMTPRLTVGYRTELALIEAGRVRVDGQRLGPCLQAIRSTCTRVATLVSGGICSRLFAGVVAGDGGCSDSLECANDGWCEFPPAPNDGCGRCRPGKPLGSPCTLDLECARAGSTSGVVCSAAAGFRCTPLDIRPEAASGGACGVASSAAAVQVGPCGPALWCDITDDSRTGTCTAAVAAGAACEQGRSVCQDGHICPASVATCQPQTIADRPGAPCSDDGETAICNHYEGLTCQEGTCRPLSGRDQPCAEDGECAFGLFCDQVALRCQAPRPEGAPCQNDAECSNERCASGPGSAMGICQTRICQ